MFKSQTTHFKLCLDIFNCFTDNPNHYLHFKYYHLFLYDCKQTVQKFYDKFIIFVKESYQMSSFNEFVLPLMFVFIFLFFFFDYLSEWISTILSPRSLGRIFSFVSSLYCSYCFLAFYLFLSHISMIRSPIKRTTNEILIIKINEFCYGSFSTGSDLLISGSCTPC